MTATVSEPPAVVPSPLPSERIGVARLATMAYGGQDLTAVWDRLAAQYNGDPQTAGAGMDLSVVAQLLGDQPAGLEIQHRVLQQQRLYRSPCRVPQPRLRLLALAAELEMGGNTPIEYLTQDSEVELTTLYIVPGLPLPDPLPAHDIAIVAAPDDPRSQAALDELERHAAVWPRPLLNRPGRIRQMDRDRLYRLLNGIPGLRIPATFRFDRRELAAAADGVLRNGEAEIALPAIIRPLGSHAGKGLVKIESPQQIGPYLAQRPESAFFVSPYIDYAGADGLFRKYRVVCVDGRPYACHMAILDKWNIWYLNAGMTSSDDKRRQEAEFMANFDDGFGRRHAAAFAGMIGRLGLDYFMVDCAETKTGELLVFEADNTAIVHDMDPPDVFPYKAAQMRKIFDAFVAMLYARTRQAEAA